MRSTLGDAKPICGPVFTFCQTDPRLTAKINEAQQRLLYMGKWVGTYQHYRFCAPSGCVTLPRSLETIETAAICNWPVRIRNEWFEFISDGFGLRDGNCVSSFLDHGEGWVAFEDVIGTGKKLRVYSDAVEAVGAKILLQFYNENALYVRTLDGVNLIDGENVAISNAQVDSVNFCMPGGLVAVQKPITNGTVFLYEYDTVNATQRLLAMYEPDETRPNYRRYVIPFAAQTGSACESQVVDVIAKRRFIPAINDQDWLIIGNTSALKMACTAIRKEENNLIQESVVYWAMAKQILDDELNQFLGDGAQPVIQIFDEFQNASVCNLV